MANLHQNPILKKVTKANLKKCKQEEQDFKTLPKVRFIKLHGEAAFVWQYREFDRLAKAANKAREEAKAATAEKAAAVEDDLLRAAAELGIDLVGSKS